MLKLLLIVAGSYLLLLGFIYLTQSRLIYMPGMPGRQLDATPKSIGLDYADVSLDTSDGVRIHGWFVAGDLTRTLLYFHGNAGNISHRLHSIRQFHELGLSVFIIDYHGYGQSEGSPSEDGLYRDAEAAWQYLTEVRGLPAEDIVVFGRSLGASVAAWLAAEQSPGALILDSAFTSVPDIAAQHYRIFPVRWLSRFSYETRNIIETVLCPVLIVHSRNDEIISFQHGRRLFEAASQPKQFLEIQGGHNDGFLVSGRSYIDSFDAFLTRYLGE